MTLGDAGAALLVIGLVIGAIAGGVELERVTASRTRSMHLAILVAFVALMCGANVVLGGINTKVSIALQAFSAYAGCGYIVSLWLRRWAAMRGKNT